MTIFGPSMGIGGHPDVHRATGLTKKPYLFWCCVMMVTKKLHDFNKMHFFCPKKMHFWPILPILSARWIVLRLPKNNFSMLHPYNPSFPPSFTLCMEHLPFSKRTRRFETDTKQGQFTCMSFFADLILWLSIMMVVIKKASFLWIQFVVQLSSNTNKDLKVITLMMIQIKCKLQCNND